MTKNTIEVRAWVVREDGGEISSAESGAFTGKLLELIEGAKMKIYGGFVLLSEEDTPVLSTYIFTNRGQGSGR